MWKSHKIAATTAIAGSLSCGKRVEKVATFSQSIYTYETFPRSNGSFIQIFHRLFHRKSRVFHRLKLASQFKTEFVYKNLYSWQS